MLMANTITYDPSMYIAGRSCKTFFFLLIMQGKQIQCTLFLLCGQGRHIQCTLFLLCRLNRCIGICDYITITENSDFYTACLLFIYRKLEQVFTVINCWNLLNSSSLGENSDNLRHSSSYLNRIRCSRVLYLMSIFSRLYRWYHIIKQILNLSTPLLLKYV